MSSKTVQPIRRREQGGNEKQTFCQTETGEKRECAKQCADHVF